MNNHPLYNRVQKIITNSVTNGSVAHSNFARIRNQPSVRAILADMGYNPNCVIRPYMWTHESIKPERKHVVLSVRQIFMKNIEAGNEVRVKDVELPNVKIIAAISVLRARGLKIKANRDEVGKKIVSYQLISEQ